MKKTKLLICLWALIMLSSLNIEAQTKATWTTTIDYNMKWLRVTPFGQVIASTSKGLLGIEPVTGQTIWTITELTNCDKNSYTTIEGSSYISITTASNWTSTSSMSDVPNKLNERVYIIDPIKGAIVFSSKDSGLKDANERYFLHNLNKLLVFGKPLEGKKVLSMMVDLKTGKVLWTKENGFKFTTSVVGIDNDQVIIVSPAFVTKINASTGEEIWRKTLDPKFAKMASFVSKTEKMLPADAEDRLSKIYFPPSRPEIFIVGVPKHFEEETLVSGSSNSSSSSGLFGSNKKKDNFANEYSSEFSAFNIKTGEYIWEFVNELKNTKLGVSFPLDDGFLVSAKDDGFYKIFKYEPDNVKTVQKGLFKGMKVVDNVREKSVKGVLKGISKLNNGTILMQCLDGKNSLVRVVDQSTGKLIYEKAAEIQGEITYVNEVNKGVVIGTSKSVGILDPVSGSWINIKPMECNPALIKMNKEKIILFNSLDNKLYSLAIDKTEFLPFSSSISFEDKKIPTNMELRKDGIFISSNQNMSLLNYDGSIKYQKHFPEPKDSFFVNALKTAGAIAAAYAQEAVKEYAATLEATKYGGDGKYNLNEALGSDRMAENVAKNLTENEAMKKIWNRRINATKQNTDSQILITEEEQKTFNDIILKKVNKSNGEVTLKIGVGTDKDPVYDIDLVEGKLYYIRKGNTLECYKF